MKGAVSEIYLFYLVLNAFNKLNKILHPVPTVANQERELRKGVGSAHSQAGSWILVLTDNGRTG